MKVLLLNGSVHTDGNTRVALEEISKQLKKEEIEELHKSSLFTLVSVVLLSFL